MPAVDLAWGDLPVDLLATTNGVDHIEIDRRLLQVDRRCALDHELAHIELGHVGGCDERGELRARLRSARRLLPLPALATALAYTLDLEHVAWDCWVTRDVLDDRLEHLTEPERSHLWAATAHHRDVA